MTMNIFTFFFTKSRKFFIRNKKFTLFVLCSLGLVYASHNFPIRVKRLDYGQTFYEFFY
jgi:hypothetical protein